MQLNKIVERDIKKYLEICGLCLEYARALGDLCENELYDRSKEYQYQINRLGKLNRMGEEIFDDIRKIYDELLELAEDIRIRCKSSVTKVPDISIDERIQDIEKKYRFISLKPFIGNRIYQTNLSSVDNANLIELDSDVIHFLIYNGERDIDQSGFTELVEIDLFIYMNENGIITDIKCSATVNACDYDTLSYQVWTDEEIVKAVNILEKLTSLEKALEKNPLEVINGIIADFIMDDASCSNYYDYLSAASILFDLYKKVLEISEKDLIEENSKKLVEIAEDMQNVLW